MMAKKRDGQERRTLERRIMGWAVIAAMAKRKLDFGPWEQILYCEFDGHRPKRVLVKNIGE